MSDQIHLTAAARTDLGKGASGRLRREGRVPGILYGYQVDPTPVHVDALELFHALHTEAGTNALIRLEVEGETHLTVARDLQRHVVKRELQHVDFLAVNKDEQISVEIPVHLVGEDDLGDEAGVVNQILYTVPILVKPLDVPNSLELSIAGLEIGDVKRVEDLGDILPSGAEFDIEPERTIVTINAPISEEALEALEEGAGIEMEEPELIGEAEAEDEAPTEEA
ncbi:MAG: 50S ribosomal protein L25 [Nitriliruptoraceae bacterium]